MMRAACPSTAAGPARATTARLTLPSSSATTSNSAPSRASPVVVNPCRRRFDVSIASHRLSSSSDDAETATSRRSSLAALVSSSLAVLTAATTSEGTAAATAAETSDQLFVPDLPARPLPDSYVASSRELIRSLRAAVAADLDPDADESKVRRKAEPAKAAVREWMGAWGDGRAPSVGGSPSHDALRSALRELGGFYSRKGQRARLDRGTADLLLSDLDEAEKGLPAETEKRKGLFS